MDGLKHEYTGRITFVRVNIHQKDTFELQKQYGFTATPEFFLVDAGGNILHHWEGDVKAAMLRETFDSVLAAAPEESP